MKSYLQLALDKDVPSCTAKALERYIMDGVPTGGFLSSVLTNDLTGAFGKADLQNCIYLENIVSFIYNDVPMGCHGSEEKVLNWKGINNKEK